MHLQKRYIKCLLVTLLRLGENDNQANMGCKIETILARSKNNFLIDAKYYVDNTLTYPVILGRSGRLATVNKKGWVSVVENKEIKTINVKALPDSRLLFDKEERLLLLAGPTRRYPHGILRNRIEVKRISMIDTKNTLRTIGSIDVNGQKVIERISPS